MTTVHTHRDALKRLVGHIIAEEDFPEGLIGELSAFIEAEELAEWELVAEGPHRVERLEVKGGAIFLVHPTNTKGGHRAPVLATMPSSAPMRAEPMAEVAAGNGVDPSAAALAQAQLEAALAKPNPHATGGVAAVGAPAPGPAPGGAIHPGNPGMDPSNYGVIPSGAGEHPPGQPGQPAQAQTMMPGFLYDDDKREQFTNALQKRLQRAAPSLNGWYSISRVIGKSGQRPPLHELYNMPQEVIYNGAVHVFGLMGFALNGDSFEAHGPQKLPKSPTPAGQAPA